MHVVANDHEKQPDNCVDLKAQYRELQELRERVVREQARIFQTPPLSRRQH